MNKYGSVTRKEVEQLVNKEKTATTLIISNLLDNNIIEKIGCGPNTKYVLK